MRDGELKTVDCVDRDEKALSLTQNMDGVMVPRGRDQIYFDERHGWFIANVGGEAKCFEVVDKAV